LELTLYRELEHNIEKIMSYWEGITKGLELTMYRELECIGNQSKSILFWISHVCDETGIKSLEVKTFFRLRKI
jgi:hypothetical protein